MVLIKDKQHVDPEKAVLKVIESAGCTSSEFISHVTGLRKYKVCKVLRKLNKWGYIRKSTRRTSDYWMVKK